MAKKQTDDLVDAGSEYSFPASDPPSYMGGAAVVGPPPEDGEPPHEPVVRELTNPDEAKPAEDAPQGIDPGRGRALKDSNVEMRSGRSSIATGTGVLSEGDTEERVRRRAYEIWESEGRSGDAEEHWFRAEREVGDASLSTRAQERRDGSQPPSEDAEKMVEQIKVAMDARKARSKQTKQPRTSGKKEATKNTGSKNAGAKKGER